MCVRKTRCAVNWDCTRLNWSCQLQPHRRNCSLASKNSIATRAFTAFWFNRRRRTHIDEAAIVRALDPRKDVDGFHPENVAKLVLDDPSGFVPCTPLGVQRLLIESNIDINGAHVVVIGRSMIVGKPLALLLMQKNKNGNATVTVVHSRSRDLAQITRSADIIIAAIGHAEFVKADHVREGAVVIDVGINRVQDATSERGYRLVGDVAFDEASKKASAITPVPGGVGPMTIAMLMSNTVKAARQSL